MVVFAMTSAWHQKTLDFADRAIWQLHREPVEHVARAEVRKGWDLKFARLVRRTDVWTAHRDLASAKSHRPISMTVSDGGATRVVTTLWATRRIDAFGEQ